MKGDSLKWSDRAINFCSKNNSNQTPNLETAKKRSNISAWAGKTGDQMRWA